MKLLEACPNKYPQHLRTAIEHILNEQCLAFVEAENFNLPRDWYGKGEIIKNIDWPRVDKFLGTLNDEDLEEFCVGEQDGDFIATICESEEGRYANYALNAIFEETEVGNYVETGG